VQRDVFDAAVFRELRSVDRVDRVIVKARADLHRERNRDHFLDLFQDRFQATVVFQQTRPAAVLDDFRRRTTTVHVENISANFLGHLGGHAHSFRLPAEDLHRKRPLVFVEPHLPFRLWIVAREPFDRDEFRNRQADTATPFQQTTKRHICNARHR